MDSQTSKKKESGVGQESITSFEASLKTAIVTRLGMLSPAGNEKVLEYINALIDSEEKQLEFHRRQGRLYHLGEEQEREKQV